MEKKQSLLYVKLGKVYSCVEKNKMNVGLWNTVFPLSPWRAQYLSLLFLLMLGMLLLIVVGLYM